ncbi:MAG: hypothetical protein FJZ04_00730, partial [Candidatus Moranbacteria bacterium]|nr:hypothetical protein [Candidatus Moranbacteria bacterium]
FVLLDPKTLAIIGIELSMAILRESIRSDRGGIRADFIAGVPNAGTPIAGAFCEEIRRISHHVVFPVKPDLIYLVKLLRDGKRAGFDISPESREKAAGGGRVILVDDLITRAHSKMLAIRKLEEAGLEVSAVLVVVDRMQGGAEEMSRAGYRTIWALDIERLLYFYCREKMISMAEYDEFARYLQANY